MIKGIITEEEFLKQPKEIRKVFINQWQPQTTDIFTTEGIEDYLTVYAIGIGDNTISAIVECGGEFKLRNFDKDKCIPVLDEGKLRQFIEDKTKGKIDLAYYKYEKNGFRGYTLEIWKSDTYVCTKQFKDLGEDLIQAYWKVAIEKAKEQIK